MASIHGKNSLSFRRKRTGSADSSPIILQDYEFAHESPGGETAIDIDALVTPTSISTGIINPTGAQLAAINLLNNSSSLVIISSDKGTLQKGSWSISNSGRVINLAFETLPNEIFTVQLRTTQATANVVDADSFVVTGTLTVGNTDIPLGQAFELNANQTQQLGEVILTIDGVEQLRNVGNATADPAADGNYEEVDAGNNQTNLLRLNQSFPVDVAYSVKLNGLVVNATPNNSFTQKLESLGGQLDAIIPTVADLAGVDETDFQAAPNNVDLKAFSDRVYQNSDDIDTLETVQATKADQTDLDNLRTNVESVLFSNGNQGVSGAGSQLFANSITLTEGYWLLKGGCVFDRSGGSASFTRIRLLWSSTSPSFDNLDNSPTLDRLSGISNAIEIAFDDVSTLFSRFSGNLTEQYVKVNSTTTVYLLSEGVFSGTWNAISNIIANKISDL